MTVFLGDIFIAAVFFGLGYFISSHPQDTRDFLTRVRASIGRLFTRS